MFPPPPCILLQTPEFDASLSNWNTSGSVSSTTDSYAGTHAAQITSYYAYITQTQTGITPGNIYNLSVYGKTESSPWWTTVGLRFYDSSYNALGESYAQVTATSYTQYQVSAVAPSNSYYIEVYALKFGSGVFKVDEFCLEESVPVIGECMLVNNESFENNLINWFTSGSVSNSTEANSGSSSVQLVGNGSRVYQRVGIQAGNTYEFTAYAKVSNSAPSSADLYIQWRDINNSVIDIAEQPVISSIKDFTQFSIKGKAPNNAAYAYLGATKDGSSSRRLYMDDVCFRQIDPLGGTSFDLICGCSENLLPNGGYEEHFVSSFNYNIDGVPVAPIADNDNYSLQPHETDIANDYMFLVDASGSGVNNPEGDYFVYLADDNDELETNVDFSDNLNLESGETYSLCFYAASWVASLNSNDLPDGGTEFQRSAVLYLQFDFDSGKRDVAAFSVPASEDFDNLAWTKFTHTFTYDGLDPISKIELENDRNNVGVAIDGISISKVDCEPTTDCGINGLNYERWTNISSNNIRELLTDPDYPNDSDESGILSSFQGPVNYGSNYGTRVYGYLVPSVSGNYTFNVTSDDNSRLYLSSDSSFFNKTEIANVPGWTQITQHTKYASQTSSTISLVAGQKYYVELVHKEGGGGDHFQVYWKTPSSGTWTIIPESRLRPICYPEICDNGRDDDLDGLIDCEDDDCNGGSLTSYTVTDENCGSGGGAIDLTPNSSDTPLSFQWSDMPITAHWNFEGSTDDVSGNLNHANYTAGSPAYSNDAIEGRNSIYFNGSTRIRYSIDQGFMEQALSALSISVWLKPDNLTGIKTIFDEGGSTGGKGMALRLTNDVITAGVRNGSGTLTSNSEHTFPMDGEWHHVAVVFDNGLFTVYLDGVPSTTQTASFTTIIKHGNNGGVGGNFGGSVLNSGSTRYRGLMDDFRYHLGIGLTDGQIADLARNDGDRTNLFAGTYDVLITTASGCTSNESITINSSSNHTDGGTIVGDESFCGASGDPSLITSASAATGGGAGTTEYQWQMSTDNGVTWTYITGATAETFDPSPISNTTLYRRGGRLYPCLAWVYSNTITKDFIEGLSSSGAVSGKEISCDVFDPAIISEDVPPSGGTGGTIEFIWQSSTDSLTWTDIPASDVGSYDPSTISQTTWFRRGCRRTPCVDYLFSSSVKKEVVINFTDGGIIAGEEAHCGSFDPDVISSVTSSSGGSDGMVEYQWQYSTDYGANWNDIAGATAETYNPTTIIQSTQYRRGARRNPCADFVFSNVISKTVVVNYNSGGLITGDQSECGTHNPTLIANSVPPSGGVDGFQTFQWEYSTDDGVSWTEIPGAISAFYDPGTISETTSYRRKARRAPCGTWINSNVVIKEVREVPVPVLLSEPTLVNGFACEFVNYTFEVEHAGAGASYNWDFGALAIPNNASGTGPHTVAYSVSDIAQYTTVSGQVSIFQNGCVGTVALDYDVRPQITVTNISTTDPSNCNAGNGQISVTTDHPGGTSVQASIDGGTTWDNEPIQFNSVAAGIYDLQLRYSGSECDFIWGTITINDPGSLSADIQISTTEICNNEMFSVEAIPDGGPGSPTYSWDFGPGATPVIAYGVGPHLVSYSTGGVKDIQLTISDNFCTGLVDTTITIVQTYSDGGTLNGQEDLCNAGPGSTISTLVSPSGGYGGTADYQWETREDDGSGGWTAWSEIAGATNENYTPALISVTSQFRRKARRLPCLDWAVSDPILKRVAGVPQPTDDVYDTACPGFLFYDYVNLNDNNLINPTYTVAIAPLNGTLDLDADGEFVYTPNSTFCGTDEFTYRVCNGGTTCCATATVTIDLNDTEVPVLQNIPADLSIHCDDEMPLPPIVDAWENCQNVTLGLDEASNQGELDSCSIYSYSIYRSWTASDYCGNNAAAQQVINIQDKTAPDIYRIYTLPNGKKMVAGVMENVSQRWKTIPFPVQFDMEPVVLAQVVSENESTTVATRLRNISTSHFQLRLQEEENQDGIHTEEDVAWIAFEKGASANDLPFEVGTALASSASSTISFDQPYSNPGFIGAIQTYNEINPASVRFDALGSTSTDVLLQEEESFDPETNHGFETIGYLLVEDTGNLTNDQGEIIGETGRVSTDHNGTSITLNHRYHNPVVIFGGVSTNSTHEALIRVKNVSQNSFEVYIEEWEYQNQWHPVEDLTYLVVEGSIPFDQEVECSDIPDIPTLGVDIVGLDNCDASTPVTVTDSQFEFDCENDTMYTRTFYVQDECGNTTTLTQVFTLRDTTPPTFSVPADVTITCLTDQHDLTITGDVTDEMDNCATGLEATYVDNTNAITGCTGYYLRIWTLVDLCGNSTFQYQKITIFNDNDADGDGLADPFDLDDDNDGIPDVDEGTGDTDGDGIPDYQDLDSDNDGIPDIIEAGFTDANGDGIVDSFGEPGWDLDGDGLANEVDGNIYDPSLSASDTFDSFTDERDRDGDGIPNWLDLDSDNDGIPDLIEAGGVDENGDGVIDYPDPNNPESLPDADGDGFYDAYDPDDDNIFGIDNAEDALVTFENGIFSGGAGGNNPDFDDDGVPDFYDLDSDNDGIADLIEVGGIDTNGDGQIDNDEFTDLDGNGFHDEYETTPLISTDGDGSVEDGRPEDTDGDGTAYNDADADNDGSPNHLDTDSDNDNINDIIETGYGSQDMDNDGQFDEFMDMDGDGFNDGSVGTIWTDGEGVNNDGRPEDGPDAGTSSYGGVLADGTFGQANGEHDLDDDGDGIPNFLDTDSDNDLLPDYLEDTNGNGVTDVGETGYLDNDSDDDLILDGVEDANQDGIFQQGIETDPLDSDTDDDGLEDGVEDANQDGVVDLFTESDPKDPCDPLVNASCIGVRISARVKLKGAMIDNGGSNIMRDDLRAFNTLPLTEPYSNLPNFDHVLDGGGEEADPSLFAVVGNDAIVDWVFIELREPSNQNLVVNTRSALLQRDGDIIDVDGAPTIFFPSTPSGYYHVTIRHRNHLGTGIEAPIILSPEPTMVDLASPGTEVYGGTFGTDISNSGERMLWPGDTNSDGKVIYQGPANDGYFIFFHVLTDNQNDQVLANFISPGYNELDVNMDGKTIFQGPGNDRAKILFHAVIATPENASLLANFVLFEKLP